MRVAICWVGVSGYLSACWRALAARPGVDVRFFYVPRLGRDDAPFRSDITEGVPGEVLSPEQLTDPQYVAGRVLAHQPDIVVIPGWVYPAFTGLIANPALAKAKFVLAIDTQRKLDRRGNFRQWAGRVKLRRLLRKFHRIIVPGERGYQYARFLGFAETQIRRGVNGCDYERFGPLLERRLARPGGWPKRFLFAGRYVPEKGLDVLLKAYPLYRGRHADAWPLTLSGAGPLVDEVRRAAQSGGVEDVGWVQPQDQPALWTECGAFVLPSRYDAWGVVITEACAAGLPVICTNICGAVPEMIRPHYNGLTVATESVEDLARGLSVIHAAYDRLPEMGRRGQPLAAAYSADAYAERWAAMFEELHAGG